MPSPQFPDVPFSTGVPAVLRSVAARLTPPEALLTRDSDDIDRLAASQWGIFDEGFSDVLKPDSIAAVGINGEHRIADYPIEKGQFESYNKVKVPSEYRVILTKGGPLSERVAFLTKLEQLSDDLNLYNVVTPERLYQNVNIVRVSQDRNAQNGATLLTVEVGLREIRQAAAAAFTNTRSAASANPSDRGSVRTVAAYHPSEEIK